MANSEDRRPFKEKYRIYIYPVVLAWVITMLVRPVISDGDAMLPKIQDGQVIIVTKHTYTPVRGTPEFQQVVAFREDFIEDGEKGDNTIRRVIGLPGDKIEIKNGKVMRNDKVLEEDYVIGETIGEVGPLVLKEDEVFVLGDNREESIDSRDPRIGPLKMELLRGSCDFRVWPINQIGRIK